ncbi:MAG: hypothetical protein WC254_01890 [Candidatus Woesearchaeota archaeon]|jgi:hypothetical protein
MSDQGFMDEAKSDSRKAIRSFNRKGFRGSTLTSVTDISTRLADPAFREEFLGEYGLITSQEARTKYALSPTAVNRGKTFSERAAEAAKRFFNPLYNYNINGVTREIQTDVARGVADLEALASGRSTDTVEEIIKNARYRDSKNILIDYVLSNNLGGVSGGISGGISGGVSGGMSGGGTALPRDYATLRDKTFTAYDTIFRQRIQAATTDLAIYGKAAAVAGGLGAVIAGTGGFALGAAALAIGTVYALKGTVGTGIASIFGDGTGGKIASALAILPLCGLSYVAAAYGAKGVLEYATNYTKRNEVQFDNTIKHTAGGNTTSNRKRRSLWNGAHTASKWGAGIISYLMPAVAYANAPDLFNTCGCSTTPVPTPIPNPSPCSIDNLYGTDTTGWDITEKFWDHGTPIKGEFHELGIHLGKGLQSGYVETHGLDSHPNPHIDASNYDLDKTVIMVEGYNAPGIHNPDLVFRQFYDVDASGKFDLTGFNASDYSSYQITWAENDSINCDTQSMHLNDLASVTHGYNYGGHGGSHTPAPHIETPVTANHEFTITPIPGGFQAQDTAGHPMDIVQQTYGANGALLQQQSYHHDAGIGTVQTYLDTPPNSSVHIWGNDRQFEHGRGDEVWIINGVPTNIPSHNIDSRIGLEPILGNPSNPGGLPSSAMGLTSNFIPGGSYGTSLSTEHLMELWGNYSNTSDIRLV